jgi:hypothetical protein
VENKNVIQFVAGDRRKSLFFWCPRLGLCAEKTCMVEKVPLMFKLASLK